MSHSREWAWQDLASCRGKDLTLFFGDPEAERYNALAKVAREARAKAVCAGCEVRQECLAYALERPERHGIYGGMTSEERIGERRRRTRRKQARAA